MITRRQRPSSRSLTARWSGTLLLMLPAIALGCSDQPILTGLGESAVDGITLSAVNKMVPIKGPLSGQADGTSNPFVCAGPATSSNPIFLEGPVSHLGWSTIEAGGCNTLTGFTFPTAFVTQVGSAPITAANGDVVYTEYVGSVEVNVNCTALTVLSLDLVITGGTGRFEGASGMGTFTGTQVPSACPPDSDPPPLFVTGSLQGQISTVGSNKN